MKVLNSVLFLGLGISTHGWAKDCSSSESIRDHQAVDSSGLILSNGVGFHVVDDIDSKFCVHTVANGAKRLSDGKHLSEFSFGHQIHETSWHDFETRSGLKVALSDAGGSSDDGVTFEQAQAVCAALTIDGTHRGEWRTPRSRYGRSSEYQWDISAESLSVYFANPNLYEFERGRFWTGSKTHSYRPVTGHAGEESWVLRLGELCSFNNIMCARMDRTQSSYKNAVMCILDRT